MASTANPGWYHIDGDAPNAYRYWNGHIWVTGPLTKAEYYAIAGPDRDLAGYGQRFAALMLDLVLTYGIPLALGGLNEIGAADEGLLLGVAGTWVLIGVVFNFFVLQGRTGKTFGKRTLNIALLRKQTLEPVGVLRCIVRYAVASVANAVVGMDYVIALISRDRERLSDFLIGANVYKDVET